MRYTATFHPAGSFLLHTESRYASTRFRWTAAAGSAVWVQDGAISRKLELDEHEATLLDTLVLSSFWLRPQAREYIRFLGAYATSAPTGNGATVRSKRGGGGAAPVFAVACDAPPRAAREGGVAQVDSAGKEHGRQARDASDRARRAESVYCCVGENASERAPRQAGSGRIVDSGGARAHSRERSARAQQHSSLPGQHSIRETDDVTVACDCVASAGDAPNSSDSAAGSTHARDRRICAAAASVEVLISLRGGRCIATVVVDPRTWRPRAVQQCWVGCPEVTELQDWRLWEGTYWFPARMQRVARGVVVQEVNVEEALACGKGRAEAALAEPFRQPPRAKWPEGAWLDPQP